MKNCSWYLWLNSRKIFNIRQLRENFDTSLLIGYFLGGSLLKWLSDLGEYDILKRLSTIDTNGDIGRQLEFAFGVSPDKKDPVAPAVTEERESQPETTDKPSVPAVLPAAVNASSFNGNIESSFFGNIESSFFGNSSVISSFTGNIENSFAGYASSASSFAYIVGNAFAAKFTSSLTSSFNIGSYSAFVSGQALNIASSAGFGSLGSFGLAFGNYISVFGGSFSLSSFNLGSFEIWFGKYAQAGSYAGSFGGSFGAFLSYLTHLLRQGGSFGSFGSFGNIGEFFGEGSFRYSETGAVITADEYRRTLINLTSCPLNAYGYGINLV